MASKRAISLVLVFLLVAIGAAAFWLSRQEQQVQTELVLYGNVDIREVDLAFNNSEHIHKLLVQEGDRVRGGQLLATLHRERAQAEVANARARVAAWRAAVARLQNGSRPQEVLQARANVAAATARLNDAQLIFERARDLSRKQDISEQALDNARANLEVARADLKVAEEALGLSIEGPRTEDIDEAKAQLESVEAQLALALEVLKDTGLYAPADGVIRNRILEPGDMATPRTPVFTLALGDPVWVRAYASEFDLGKLSPGMLAEVSTDSYPGKAYRGWVGYISPTAEFTPKNVQTPELRTRLVYQVRIYVCNPQDELRLGMPATVSIDLDQAKPKPGQTVPACTRPGDG